MFFSILEMALDSTRRYHLNIYSETTSKVTLKSRTENFLRFLDLGNYWVSILAIESVLGVQITSKGVFVVRVICWVRYFT